MINKTKVRHIASKKKLPKFADNIAALKIPQVGLNGIASPYDPTNPSAVKGLINGQATNIGLGPASTGMSAATMGGIGSAATGIGGMMKTQDASSPMNYAGDILGDAGTGASMGAAFGPWGMAAGALVGGIYGGFDAAHADKMQQRANTQTQINKDLIQNNAMSGEVNANYNIRNMQNDRVPGLAKGAAMFKSNQQNPNQPNAMIAPEEGVMDGQTGRVGVVPGSYNPANPDTVPANLTEGSSVFSKKANQTIPGGKSTPADVIARATKVQKMNDKIIAPKAGERKPSRLDELTAKLNQRNMQMQLENLNKFNTLANPQQQGGQLPTFDGGVNNFRTSFTNKKTGANIYPTDYDKLSDTEKQGYNTIGEPMNTSDKGGNALYRYSNNSTSDRVVSSNATNVQPALPGQKTRLIAGGTNTDPNNIIAQPNKQIVNNKVVDTNQKPVTTTVPINPNASANSTAAYNGITNSLKSNVAAINNNLGTGSGMATTNPTIAPASILSPSKTLSTDGNINDSLGVMRSDFDPIVANKPYSAPSYTVPQRPGNGGPYQMYKQSDFPINSPAGTPPPTNPPAGDTGLGDKLSSLGNKAMSLAPIVYNAWNDTPEVASPIYQNYINPNQRYNIAPELSEATKQRQIARYGNASINSSTGSNMAYGSDVYSRGQDQLSELMGKAQTANAGYRNQYAERANQQAGADAAENRRIYDVNARNRAASRTFGAANANMLSQYGQVNQLMSNQKDADVLNSNIWGAYATAVDPKEKAYLKSLVTKHIGRS